MSMELAGCRRARNCEWISFQHARSVREPHPIMVAMMNTNDLRPDSLQTQAGLDISPAKCPVLGMEIWLADDGKVWG